jgi:hypothetical protein
LATLKDKHWMPKIRLDGRSPLANATSLLLERFQSGDQVLAVICVLEAGEGHLVLGQGQLAARAIGRIYDRFPVWAMLPAGVTRARIYEAPMAVEDMSPGALPGRADKTFRQFR